jgi:hypothetical protein
MARPGEAGEQKFEIALFTCAFLAGGLLIITLILAVFMNPSAASEVTSLESSYKEQVKLLRSPEMRNLRAQAKVSEGQDNKKTLKEIISEQLKAAAGGPLTLVPLEGLDHNAPRPSTYPDRIVTFLTKSLPSSWRTP